jgi:hypothetical protein
MHIPTSDLHVYELDQDEIDNAPRITFGQMLELAKAQGLTSAALKEMFKGDVAAEVFDKMFMRPFSAAIVPYAALIDWYRMAAGKLCRCGCMTRTKERFATPTCRTRYEILMERGKIPARVPRKRQKASA